ncbi:ATP synthase subunit delta, sodium ion specific [Posidoniimonas polymericola]|uniref:ATP synthase subunit delta n=1 Tax=Posidoniimonas polymericola TaxID=2528002 RepID=A0A5C5YM89_9BACT|nr:ATP synthase F1 subunit delta [Posidoniimonas polymericola]TWT75966.1 ATP synthase subunit delta, sodium ion specific [Posidoniimonas polymericola]
MPIDPQNLPNHDTVLDVTEEQIGKTYAKAVLGAAAGNEWTVVEELQAIVDEILNPHPGFIEPLRSAFVSHEERGQILDRVFGGKVSDTVLHFLKVLSAHNRLGILRTIVRETVRLYQDRNNNVRVRVVSAEPLDDALLGDITNALRSQTGQEPIMTTEVDPDLIAGMQVHVGDTVYDSSLRTAFAKARRAIVNSTIQQIEQNPQQFFSTN